MRQLFIPDVVWGCVGGGLGRSSRETVGPPWRVIGSGIDSMGLISATHSEGGIDSN